MLSEAKHPPIQGILRSAQDDTAMIGRRLSHFRVTAKLGAGGMGEVYRAEDLELAREVAIKVLPAELSRDPERLRRLEGEAKALAALNHPNIVAIYSIEHEGDVRFLVMELVDGPPLDRMIPPTGLALDSLFAIALQLCDGLTAAHERGIIHRDLKPSNIIVTADRRVKILDFGLAKQQAPVEDGSTDVMTRAGTILGTVPYMSPEQLQGRPLDARTDIFSLGTILYEMAVGRRPFRGDTHAELISSILRDAPTPIAEVRPDLPRELQQVVERALEKSAARRYQTIAELRQDLARRTETAPTSTDIRSIAVMPLDNLSRDPAQDYFAEGMTEALITDLAKVTGLKVISRMSVMRYKGSQKPPGEIARELGVDAIVEGSVITVGQRVRVTAQLIEGRSERHLWAERYDREMHDVLMLQDELTRAIAGEVRSKLLPDSSARRPGRVDPEVYRLDLKGRHHWNKRTGSSFHAGLESFQQAIDIDPEYAPAWVGLADCYGMLCNYGILEPSIGSPRARAAVSKALQLDPRSAEAHRTLALCQWQFDFDWAQAELSYRRALELDPNSSLTTYWYGAFIGVIGRQLEGVEVLRRAEELDPLSLSIPAVQGWLMYFARRFGEAIRYYRDVLDMDPHLMLAHWFLGQALSEIGEHDRAVKSLQTAMELGGPESRLIGYLGYALGRGGRVDEARAQLAQLEKRAAERYVPPYFRALIHAGLGEREQALDVLEDSYERKDSMLRDLLVDPPWDRLRDEARFQAVLGKMKYPA